jgi:hypothetical protein
MQDYTGAFEKIAGKRGLVDSMAHAHETIMRTLPAVPSRKSWSNVSPHYTKRVDQLFRAVDNKVNANGGYAALRKHTPTAQELDNKTFSAIKSGLSKNRHLSDMDKHRLLRTSSTAMGR